MKRLLRNLWSRLIGWRLAHWLDRRYPSSCWAHLATDIGMGWDLRGWRRAITEGRRCDQDCERLGSCWCGKKTKDQ